MPGPIPFKMIDDKRPYASSDKIVPKAPSWLNKNAKKIFNETAKKLVDMKMAGSADQSTIAIYAFQYDRLMSLSNASADDLRSQKLQNDLVSSVLSLSNQLGLTPGGRARLRIKQEDDIEEQLHKAIV
jgi:phage terminase small subunit